MLGNKKGASALTLILCMVAIALVTTALVVATNNTATVRADIQARKEAQIASKDAYIKIYTLSEVQQIAKQAFVDNYISFFENEVSFIEFRDLVLKQMQDKIPVSQMNNFNINIYNDGVAVEYK